MANETTTQTTSPRAGRRKLAFMALGATFLGAALVYGSWWAVVGRYHQATDDAYVAGNEVPVTAEAQGTVTAVLADETSEVHEGQVLVRLDDSDARVALQAAEAKLASTVRRVEQLYATARQLDAKVAAQQATLALARSDYARHKNLNDRGYFSASALEHSATSVQVDEHDLTEARQALSAVRAEVVNTDIVDHPDVKLAAAEVRAAYLNLERMTIVSPVTGYVAKRNVQIGARVDGNAPLMVVVPLDQIWVNANFKESQLGRIKPGQPVTLRSDLYGGGMAFHGTVVGVDAGTGSAFALLPAQNATGNWIKVVQRVPVRVAIAREDFTTHPLRIGLSMDVDVNTRASGNGAAGDPPAQPAYTTSVYEQRLAGAEQLIAAIISSNSAAGNLKLAVVSHDR
ncbi:MAG TPA: efflux RND transporter periplasmic adaptor subunit [Gammaproteobacteria bacterium]|nr:efflux RND transporter periplasmic adaptor subunit [Gammaproteobacteria bacterium]